MIAPWFIVLVCRLCEPQRRLPLRIAERYLGRIETVWLLTLMLAEHLHFER